MPAPTIELLGIYRLNITDEILEDQIAALVGSGAVGEVRADAEVQARYVLDNVVLIEVSVQNRDDRFTINDFVQPQQDAEPGMWQAAWLETFLSEDGEALVAERWSTALPETADLRIAFFIHFWDEATPLRSSYGDIACSSPRPMPERLEALVPYMACD
jgi:hypothetical protein